MQMTCKKREPLLHRRGFFRCFGDAPDSVANIVCDEQRAIATFGDQDSQFSAFEALGAFFGDTGPLCHWNILTLEPLDMTACGWSVINLQLHDDGLKIGI
jgi:hypothetical protein